MTKSQPFCANSDTHLYRFVVLWEVENIDRLDCFFHSVHFGICEIHRRSLQLISDSAHKPVSASALLKLITHI